MVRRTVVLADEGSGATHLGVSVFRSPTNTARCGAICCSI
jgi:hypothetical protein